jgi:hypothetical protein
MATTCTVVHTESEKTDFSEVTPAVSKLHSSACYSTNRRIALGSSVIHVLTGLGNVRGSVLADCKCTKIYLDCPCGSCNSALDPLHTLER